MDRSRGTGPRTGNAHPNRRCRSCRPGAGPGSRAARPEARSGPTVVDDKQALALDAADQLAKHGPVRQLLEALGEPAEERGRRRDDRVGRRVALADLARIDIDVDEGLRRLKLRREPVGRHVAEAGADRDDDVDAALEVTARRAMTAHAEDAERRADGSRKHALALRCGRHRATQSLGDRAQLRGRTGTAYTAAGEDQRTLGGLQELGELASRSGRRQRLAHRDGAARIAARRSVRS